MDLKLNYLQHFTAAVEAGSIVKAARRLNISQPGLSRSIRLLEEELEVTLLERSVKGVTPTDYGANFYTRAKSILFEADRAKVEIREMRGEIGRIITIGALPSQANFILPQATIKFLSIHKNVKIKVIQKARDEILTSLRKGEFDFIFSILDDGAISQVIPDDEITSRLLFYDRPSIIVRHDHPALKAGKNIVKALLEYSWVLPRPESDQRFYVNQYYAGAGLSLPKVAVVECQTTPYLKTLVAESDFVGILPTSFISHEEKTGLIKCIEIPGMKNTIPFGIQYRSDRLFSGLAESMFYQMKTVCRELKTAKSERLDFQIE